MTNEQQKAKELAELLNAFADGKQLQYQDECDGTWEDCKLSASLNGIMENLAGGFYFRIKPETKRVPLTMQDLIDRELSGKTISVIYNKMVSHILRYSDSKIYFSEKEIRDYEYLTDFTFIDGTPCYKEVECE